MNILAKIGIPVIHIIQTLGRVILFFVLVLSRSKMVLHRPHLTIRQIYFAGVLSVVIVAVSGLFVGMVMGLQGYTQLARFKSADILGYVVTAGLLRELAPVLTAILFASSAGSAMTSEIGLMKSTEQLDAMNIMAVDPIARIIAPRFWAGMISMPLLASICNISGIYGAYFIGVHHLGLDSGLFWSTIHSHIDLHYDVINGIIKSIIFGIVVSLIALYQGFHATPTPEGILKASTHTVVASALSILMLDFVMTAFMFTLPQ